MEGTNLEEQPPSTARIQAFLIGEVHWMKILDCSGPELVHGWLEQRLASEEFHLRLVCREYLSGVEESRGWQTGNGVWDSPGICHLGILQGKAIHKRCHTMEVIVKPLEEMLAGGPHTQVLCSVCHQRLLAAKRATGAWPAEAAPPRSLLEGGQCANQKGKPLPPAASLQRPLLTNFSIVPLQEEMLIKSSSRIGHLELRGSSWITGALPKPLSSCVFIFQFITQNGLQINFPGTSIPGFL